MGSITASNFQWNSNQGVLTFQPLKHGVLRVHRVPPELIPYLKDYSYEAKRLSGTAMNREFHMMCNQLGLKLPKPRQRAADGDGRRQYSKGVNWHAFRHSVDTALLESGVDEASISRWMGWRSKPGMVRHYFTPEEKDIDSKVLAKHPFLKAWK